MRPPSERRKIQKKRSDGTCIQYPSTFENYEKLKGFQYILHVAPSGEQLFVLLQSSQKTAPILAPKSLKINKITRCYNGRAARKNK
mgnify:CR=1 FL=1